MANDGKRPDAGLRPIFDCFGSVWGPKGAAFARANFFIVCCRTVIVHRRSIFVVISCVHVYLFYVHLHSNILFSLRFTRFRLFESSQD